MHRQPYQLPVHAGKFTLPSQVQPVSASMINTFTVRPPDRWERCTPDDRSSANSQGLRQDTPADRLPHRAGASTAVTRHEHRVRAMYPTDPSSIQPASGDVSPSKPRRYQRLLSHRRKLLHLRSSLPASLHPFPASSSPDSPFSRAGTICVGAIL